MSRTIPRQALVLIALICALLPTLAALQYRWLGELSELERVRAQKNLDAAGARLSTEFDAALANVFTRLNALDAGGAQTAARRRDLLATGLVLGVYAVDASHGTPLIHEIDADGAERAAVAFPALLKQRVEKVAPGGRVFEKTLIDDVPAIVLESRRRGRWLVAVLDLPRIGRDVIPELLAGCLDGGIPADYDVLIIRDDVRDRTVYRSRTDLAKTDYARDHGTIPLFAIHGRDLEGDAGERLQPDAAAHRWRLFVQHQHGALEATLAAVRSRNMAIGVGVLALLAVSIGLLVALAHRRQRAAQQQLEFVARLSHELRTPLATLNCAGENLEDGVVQVNGEVRSYGSVIRRESQRLTRTVADILLCCRLQAQAHQVLTRRPVDVRHLIEGAVEECRVATTISALAVSVAPDIGQVIGDAEALRMALKNLVLNAFTHGLGQSVSITATQPAGATYVQIAVEDRGPGITQVDLASVFEPFFRGQRARDHAIAGTGIGLSIVRDVVRGHDGQLHVSPVTPSGARFVLRLPASARPAAPMEPAA
jgi:two-component system sensor histidine kinase SenX3